MPDPIARHLTHGCRVAIADGCGAPTGLAAELSCAARAVDGVRVLLGWTLTSSIDVSDATAFPDVRTVMGGYALRNPLREGRVHSLPVRLGSVPAILAATWRPDVVVAAFRPGAHGLVFGSEVGWMRAAVETGATVLAQVNHGLPDATDGVPVPAEQIVVYLARASSGSRAGSACSHRSAARPPGLVPQVTIGAIRAASRLISRSKRASLSVASVDQASTARSKSAPRGAYGRPLR